MKFWSAIMCLLLAFPILAQEGEESEAQLTETKNKWLPVFEKLPDALKESQPCATVVAHAKQLHQAVDDAFLKEVETLENLRREKRAERLSPQATSDEIKAIDTTVTETEKKIDTQFETKLKLAGFEGVAAKGQNRGRDLYFEGKKEGLTYRFLVKVIPEKGSFKRMFYFEMEPFTGDSYTGGSDQRHFCALTKDKVKALVGDLATGTEELKEVPFPLFHLSSSNGVATLSFEGKEKVEIPALFAKELGRAYPAEAPAIEEAASMTANGNWKDKHLVANWVREIPLVERSVSSTPAAPPAVDTP